MHACMYVYTCIVSTCKNSHDSGSKKTDSNTSNNDSKNNPVTLPPDMKHSPETMV